MTTRTADLPIVTARNLAACHVVGLSYWADHPKPAHVWAVDQYQRAHVVRISPKDGTAQHVCNRYAAINFTTTCAGEDRVMSWASPSAIAEHHGVSRFDVTANLLGLAPIPTAQPVQDPAPAEPTRPALTVVQGERCPGYGQVVDGDGRRAKCPECGRSVKRYTTGKLGSHRVA